MKLIRLNFSNSLTLLDSKFSVVSVVLRFLSIFSFLSSLFLLFISSLLRKKDKIFIYSYLISIIFLYLLTFYYYQRRF